MRIAKIIERKDVVLYLKERNLFTQYKKSKNFLLLKHFSLVNFNKRNPKKDKIWYFRINKQFRALAYFDNDILIIFDIDNHQ